MHEDLLGYLLGALEPHEMRRIDRWLKEDPTARQQLAEVERLLRSLDETSEAIESPPSDLVARTIANLPPLPSPGTSDVADAAKAEENDPFEIGAPVSGLVAMQGNLEPPRNSTLTWLDWAGGAVAAAVLLALLLPSIAEGRFEARKSACQYRLSQLGTALTRFVIRNEQARLPAVSESGPEAFAGVYAVRLREAGLMDDPSIRWCPSLDPPSEDQVALTRLSEVASLSDLHEASVDRLREIQQFAGGHYAYTLGVIDDNRFAPPRYESRSSFAVMSDAPLARNPVSETIPSAIGHSRAGINVLFEDGRVQFVSMLSLTAMPDHPLLNHRGQVEAGVNIDDASLAPSWRPPFVDVRQR